MVQGPRMGSGEHCRPGEVVKLKTEMEGSCVLSRGYGIDSAKHFPLDVARFEHDAAAAHAYQQAIKEWWDGPVEDLDSESAVTLIEEWADEIMREWGYDETSN